MILLESRPKRVIQFVTVLLCIFETSAEGISCFKCHVSPVDYQETNQLCSKFDGSEKFQVHCPTSTLCMKKTVHYKFKSNITVAVQRDCAPQKRTVQTYDYADNKWHNKEEIVKTAYEEGCFIGEDRGAPGGPPEYCFCSFNLCNSSESIRIVNLHSICLLAVTMLLTRSLQNFLFSLPTAVTL